MGVMGVFSRLSQPGQYPHREHLSLDVKRNAAIGERIWNPSRSRRRYKKDACQN